MSFQTTVNQKLAFGVVGSFYDDSPRRVAPYHVESGAIAKAFTVDSTDPTKAVVGDDGVFAGIAVNTKEYPISALTASLEFRSGAIAQLCTMGHIVVACDNAVAIGNACYYKEADGTLHAAASGQSIEGYIEIPGSEFIFVTATSSAGEVAVLQLH